MGIQVEGTREIRESVRVTLDEEDFYRHVMNFLSEIYGYDPSCSKVNNDGMIEESHEEYYGRHHRIERTAMGSATAEDSAVINMASKLWRHLQSKKYGKSKT